MLMEAVMTVLVGQYGRQHRRTTAGQRLSSFFVVARSDKLSLLNCVGFTVTSMWWKVLRN